MRQACAGSTFTDLFNEQVSYMKENDGKRYLSLRDGHVHLREGIQGRERWMRRKSGSSVCEANLTRTRLWTRRR